MLPPVQLLKLAVPGETVTERIVGTTFREIATLAPLLATGAALLVKKIRAITTSTPRITTHAQLRRTLITYSGTRSPEAISGTAVGVIPLDPDPKTGSANTEDRECQQE